MIAFSRYIPSRLEVLKNKKICLFPTFEITKSGNVKRFEGTVLPIYKIKFGIKYSSQKIISDVYMVETIKGKSYSVELLKEKGVFSLGKTLDMLIPNRLNMLGATLGVTTTDFYRFVLLAESLEAYLDGLGVDYRLKGKDKAGKFSVLDVQIKQFVNNEYMNLEVRNLSREQILEHSSGFNVKIKGQQHGVLQANEVLLLLQSLRAKIE